jgi:hypothetical protein
MQRGTLALVAVGMLAAACTGPSSVERAPATPDGHAARGYERPCVTAVYGEMPKGWQRDVPVVGPVAFIGLRPDGSIPSEALDPGPDGVAAAKVLLIVRDGVRVTLSVDDASADRISFAYELGRDADAVADGAASVTFGPCSGGATRFDDGVGTQFNGGFVVATPGCARIEVAWEDERRSLPVRFGGPCPGGS